MIKCMIVLIMTSFLLADFAIAYKMEEDPIWQFSTMNNNFRIEKTAFEVDSHVDNVIQYILKDVPNAINQNATCYWFNYNHVDEIMMLKNKIEIMSDWVNDVDNPYELFEVCGLDIKSANNTIGEGRCYTGFAVSNLQNYNIQLKIKIISGEGCIHLKILDSLSGMSIHGIDCVLINGKNTIDFVGLRSGKAYLFIISEKVAEYTIFGFTLKMH